MRSSSVIVGGILFLLSASVPAGTMPSTWQPAYWDESLHAIGTLREHGDKQGAENLCADTIHYAEQQAIQALKDYADLLDSQSAGSGGHHRIVLLLR